MGQHQHHTTVDNLQQQWCFWLLDYLCWSDCHRQDNSVHRLDLHSFQIHARCCFSEDQRQTKRPRVVDIDRQWCVMEPHHQLRGFKYTGYPLQCQSKCVDCQWWRFVCVCGWCYRFDHRTGAVCLFCDCSHLHLCSSHPFQTLSQISTIHNLVLLADPAESHRVYIGGSFNNGAQKHFLRCDSINFAAGTATCSRAWRFWWVWFSCRLSLLRYWSQWWSSSEWRRRNMETNPSYKQLWHLESVEWRPESVGVLQCDIRLQERSCRVWVLKTMEFQWVIPVNLEAVG